MLSEICYLKYRVLCDLGGYMHLYNARSYTFKNDNFHKTILIIAIHFFQLLATSSCLYPPQVENCDNNSRLVVNEDDNVNFRLDHRKYTLMRLLRKAK